MSWPGATASKAFSPSQPIILPQIRICMKIQSDSTKNKSNIKLLPRRYLLLLHNFFFLFLNNCTSREKKKRDCVSSITHKEDTEPQLHHNITQVQDETFEEQSEAEGWFWEDVGKKLSCRYTTTTENCMHCRIRGRKKAVAREREIHHRRCDRFQPVTGNWPRGQQCAKWGQPLTIFLTYRYSRTCTSV